MEMKQNVSESAETIPRPNKKYFQIPRPTKKKIFLNTSTQPKKKFFQIPRPNQKKNIFRFLDPTKKKNIFKIPRPKSLLLFSAGRLFHQQKVGHGNETKCF